jgi:hypothetical protein
MRQWTVKCLLGVCTCASLALLLPAAHGQVFRYTAKPRAGTPVLTFADSGAAPRPLAHELTRGGSILQADAEAIAPGTADPFGSDWPPGRQPQIQTSDAYDPGQPEIIDPGAAELPYPDDAAIAPEIDAGPFLDEAQACGDECGCECQCRRCYLKRWWEDLHGEAKSGGAFFENLSFFTGKQGFKGPVDLGVNGDFGFHGGGNWGMPLIDAYGVGFQIGGNYLISDFDGRSGPLTHRRTQFFATSGLFHRVSGDRGFEGGAVVDYLRDDFYIQMDLVQIRAEASYFYHGHEIGFWGAIHQNTSTHVGETSVTGEQEFSYQGNDQCNLFYRYEFCTGSYCRTWMGMSGHGDGIFGSDATVHLSQTCGLLATYNYLLPRNDEGVPNNVKESWNLTISVVWYPGYKRRDSWLNPYRPLFYVADNGWFLVRQAQDY